MNLLPEYIFLAIFFLWLLILTALFVKFYLSVSKISRGSKKDSVVEILNELIEKDQGLRKDLDAVGKEINRLSTESQFYINKVGLVRFNPFNDTGGDQSFILALVDNEDSGVVISGLHTRNGTRWYAKRIENGKGVDYELSEEEVKAIKSATKRHKKTI